jgi:hypothetical protein
MILAAFTLFLLSIYFYLKNKVKKDEVQSQLVVFSALSLVTILVIISCCCTILNFIFRWII